MCRSIFFVIIDNRTVATDNGFIGKRKSDFLFFVCLFVSSIFQFFFVYLLFQYTDTRVSVFCLTENHLYCYNCITVAICFLFGYYYYCCCLKREKIRYTAGTIKFKSFFFVLYIFLLAI